MFYSFGKGFIFLVAWLDLILTTIVLYLLSFLPKKFIQNLYPYLFRSWCWIFIRALGVTLKLHQKNQYALPQHYILIGNHPSVLEDLGMPALFNAQFLAKEEIKTWWILGRLSVATGTLFVKRESKESRREASEAIIETLLQSKNVGIYPEGGCKGRRIHLPFQMGSFHAAIQTGIPIVPVFLHYEAQEDFEWGETESLFSKLWKILKSQNKTAHYYIYDAIDPKHFDSKEALCDYVQTLYLRWQTQYLE